MCDVVTALTMGIGAISKVAAVSAQNQALAAQQEQVDNQLQRTYIEQQYENREQKEAALKEAYVAEIDRRQAVGAAIAKTASLGIRGTTANEVASEQNRIGSYNVTNAMEGLRSADASYTISSSLSRANAQDQIDALESQKVSPFGMLLGAVGGAIGGISTGQSINSSLDDPFGVLTGV